MSGAQRKTLPVGPGLLQDILGAHRHLGVTVRFRAGTHGAPVRLHPSGRRWRLPGLGACTVEPRFSALQAEVQRECDLFQVQGWRPVPAWCVGQSTPWSPSQEDTNPLGAPAWRGYPPQATLVTIGYDLRWTDGPAPPQGLTLSRARDTSVRQERQSARRHLSPSRTASPCPKPKGDHRLRDAGHVPVPHTVSPCPKPKARAASRSGLRLPQEAVRR